MNSHGKKEGPKENKKKKKRAPNLRVWRRKEFFLKRFLIISEAERKTFSSMAGGRRKKGICQHLGKERCFP